VRWTDARPHGGFTTGEPWLPALDVPGGGVAEQREDRGSILWLYKDLIALRRELGEGLELLDAEDGVVAYRRGSDHVVALNLAGEERRAPGAGTMLRHTHGATGRAPAHLGPGEGFVANASG
jgi:alpha-glucosidase